MSKTICRKSAARVALALAATLATSACASAGQSLLGFIDGPLNDPENRGLRRAILSYGLKEFCAEMTSRSAPLALTAGAPAIGRFYPETCVAKEVDGGDFVVDFSGRGYGYTNVSKKMAFATGGRVRYNQDFLMDGSTMYAYFRTKEVLANDFRLGVVESGVASFVNALTSYGDTFGRQLVQSKLQEGFTVVRESNGSAGFALGILEKGKKPNVAFAASDGHVTLESGFSEVHTHERDFIGPIKVKGSGRAIFVKATVDGCPAIDVMLMDGTNGRQSLELYMNWPQTGPLAGNPMFSETVAAGMGYKRTVPVREGTYYLVLDNTASAGTTMPAGNGADDRAAAVRYQVELGDAP
ncbi:MAG: hypothetical protein U0169_26350 [Polyangiaceae bacterium]